MNDSMMGKDIWVRSHTRSGSKSVSHHRVYDIERFMAARDAACRSELGKAEKERSGADVVKVERVAQGVKQ